MIGNTSLCVASPEQANSHSSGVIYHGEQEYNGLFLPKQNLTEDIVCHMNLYTETVASINISKDSRYYAMMHPTMMHQNHNITLCCHSDWRPGTSQYIRTAM